MSVVILAVGAVVVMQALARVSHAQVLAASHTNAYLFALSKMAGIELAFREGQEVQEHEEGRFQIDNQAFQWEAVASLVSEDPQLRLVSLAVAWRVAGRAFERRLETLLRMSQGSP